MSPNSSQAPARSATRRLGVFLVASAMLGCAAGRGRVTRIADGLEYEGRGISAEAYADYARGAALEAAGHDAHALSAYQAARAHDPESPEIFARLGAVNCRMSRAPGDAPAEQAEESFERALAIDPTSSRAWTEWARCAKLRGNPKQAEEAALNAARFDASPATALLLIDLAGAAGDTERARAWLDELVVRWPTFRPAWRALQDFGVRNRDVAREHRAERALRELGEGRSLAPRLDAALLAGDLERARSEARRLGLRPGELALEAVLRGAPALGRAQADLVLSADPDDTNAWVARLAAAHDTGDAQARLETLERVPLSATPASALAVRLLAEILEQLVGSEARATWEAAQIR